MTFTSSGHNTCIFLPFLIIHEKSFPCSKDFYFQTKTFLPLQIFRKLDSSLAVSYYRSWRLNVSDCNISQTLNSRYYIPSKSIYWTHVNYWTSADGWPTIIRPCVLTGKFNFKQSRTRIISLQILQNIWVRL